MILTDAEQLIRLQAKINKLEIYLQRERELNHICQKCGHENKKSLH
jgi:hypothetical protein